MHFLSVTAKRHLYMRSPLFLRHFYCHRPRFTVNHSLPVLFLCRLPLDQLSFHQHIGPSQRKLGCHVLHHTPVSGTRLRQHVFVLSPRSTVLCSTCPMVAQTQRWVGRLSTLEAENVLQHFSALRPDLATLKQYKV